MFNPIKLKISQDQIIRANQLYEFNNIKNSFTNGKSQIYGALGEIVLCDYLDLPEENYIGDRNYDIIHDGLKIDIKTKKVNSEPRGNYYNSVAINSFVQKCDAYIFMRVNTEMTLAWVCGFIRKKEFMNEGIYHEVDDLDPLDANFSFKEDCMNIQIQNCSEIPIAFDAIKSLKQIFKIIKKDSFYIGNYSIFNMSYSPRLGRLIIKKEKKIIYDDFLAKKEDFNKIKLLLA